MFSLVCPSVILESSQWVARLARLPCLTGIALLPPLLTLFLLLWCIISPILLWCHNVGLVCFGDTFGAVVCLPWCYVVSLRCVQCGVIQLVGSGEYMAVCDRGEYLGATMN